MSQFYCFTCDRYRDSDTEDHADYDGEEIVCGDCVDAREEQQQEFQAWWQSIDADQDYINEEMKWH